MVDEVVSKMGEGGYPGKQCKYLIPVKPFTQLKWEEIEAKLLGEIKAFYNATQAVLPIYD